MLRLCGKVPQHVTFAASAAHLFASAAGPRSAIIAHVNDTEGQKAAGSSCADTTRPSSSSSSSSSKIGGGGHGGGGGGHGEENEDAKNAPPPVEDAVPSPARSFTLWAGAAYSHHDRTLTRLLCRSPTVKKRVFFTYLCTSTPRKRGVNRLWARCVFC